MYKLLLNIYNWVVFRSANLRGRFWGLFTKEMGERVFILKGAALNSPRGISIGHDVSINHHANLDGHGQLIIGNYVLIAPYCSILTSNHKFSDPLTPITCQHDTYGKVVLEDDVWLGTHVVVMPGVTIHKGAIVGANAVVTKDVDAYTIVGGVPAKFIKDRFSQEDKVKAQSADYSSFKIK